MFERLRENLGSFGVIEQFCNPLYSKFQNKYTYSMHGQYFAPIFVDHKKVWFDN